MIIDTITEAKAQLSALLDRVQRGQEIILCRNGKPVAVLVPFLEDRMPRTPGLLQGKIRIAEDFDELPPDIADIFGLSES
jgi:prevent-host-death family protein